MDGEIENSTIVRGKFKTEPKKGGYIDRSRGDEEEVYAIASFHWWYDFQAWAALLIFGIVLIGIWVFAKMMIVKCTTEIGVTSARFIYKTGLISRETNEIALMNIESVRISQGVWGRMLGYGRLRLEGTGVGVIEIPDIANPVGFRATILNAKNAQRKEQAKAV